MGEAFLDYKKGGSGLDINGIIEDYYVAADGKVSAGDFVEFINGIASSTTETSVDTLVSGDSEEGRVISATQLDDTRVFVAHGGGASSGKYLYGIVCIINGAEINIGSLTRINTGMYSGDAVSAVTLDENRVFIAHRYGNNSYLYGVVCTISGTTISVGTDTKIREYSGAGSVISALLLGANKVFIAFSITNKLNGIVCTISGTTITAGTYVALSTTNYSGYTISTELLSDGNVFIAHSYGSSYMLNGMVCTVSGTTITAGTDTSLNGTSATGYTISTELLSDGNVFIAHGYQAYYLYGVVCTVNGTTIKKGENTMLIDATHMAEKLSTVVLPNGKVFIAHNYNDGLNYFLHGIVCTISGTTISVGTDTRLNDTNYTGYTISSVLLDNGTIFLAHSYPHNSSNYWLYAQIFGIDEANNIPTNNVVITDYETQVRPATSLPCNGVASTSGEGGDSSGHKDVVSVYRMPYSVYNLIKNGDFSKGLEGWTKASVYEGQSTWTVVDEEPYNNCLKIECIVDRESVGDDQGDGYDQYIDSVSGHKYYVVADVKVSAESIKNKPVLTVLGANRDALGASIPKGSWGKYSIMCTATSSQFRVYLNFTITKCLGDLKYYDNIKAFDLTEIFGAGNEPTQEWCDANL